MTGSNSRISYKRRETRKVTASFQQRKSNIARKMQSIGENQYRYRERNEKLAANEMFFTSKTCFQKDMI